MIFKRPLLEWKKPEPVRRWETEREVPFLRRITLFTVKAGCIIGVAVLIIAYLYARSEFLEVLRAVIVAPAVLAGCLALEYCAHKKIEAPFCVTTVGVWSSDLSQTYLDRWRSIEAIRFEDHPDVPGMRVAILTIRELRQGRRLPFDPNITNERELSMVFAEHARWLAS